MKGETGEVVGIKLARSTYRSDRAIASRHFLYYCLIFFFIVVYFLKTQFLLGYI